MLGHTFHTMVLATRWPYIAHTAVDFHILGSIAPTDCNPPAERITHCTSGSRDGLWYVCAAEGKVLAISIRELKQATMRSEK